VEQAQADRGKRKKMKKIKEDGTANQAKEREKENEKWAC